MKEFKKIWNLTNYTIGVFIPKWIVYTLYRGFGAYAFGFIDAMSAKATNSLEGV